MIINKIILTNFTSYEGEYVFEFGNDKRFNLINGENGNGKTSLLKSIIFGLYGSKMFDSSHVTKQYKDFIISALNNNTKDNYFSVTLYFEYQNTNYEITRKIIVNKSRDNFDESEIIIADGKVVKECALLSEYSKDVIELFFFNGETILDIIKSNKFNSYINQLINISFNINTFDQLKEDLNKSISNDFKEISTDKYDNLLSKLKHLNGKKDYVEKEIIQFNNLIEKNELNYKFALSKMEKHGILLNGEVQKLTNEEQTLKYNNANIDKDITNMLVNGSINNLLLDVINKKKAKQLDATRQDRIDQLVKQYEYIHLDSADEDYDLIDYNLEKNILKRAKLDAKVEHDFIQTNIKSYIKQEKKIKSIRNKLNKSEDGQKYVDFNDNIDFYVKEIAHLKDKLSNLITSNEEITNAIDELHIEIDIEKKDMLKSNLQANALNEKEKLIKIVDEYKRIKLKEITKDINAELNYVLKDVLLRKSNLIDTIKIKNGELIITQKKKVADFANFSAGEQQMLIVGVILSILKSSKNMNPLVLDTFIGRLDSEHTKNILGFLEKEIENQVIILTTDREITKKEYDMIKDEINISYRLENDGYKTKLGKGYFNYEN